MELLRSSAVLTFGNAAARLLSLLFSITTARLLEPAGYGVFAYALVVANVGSILIVNAPLGLTRFLSRHRDDPRERDAYFTNWILVIACIVAASLALMVPVGILAGLGGWLLPALLANLVGTAVLETYLQVQCGLERFRLMVGFWTLANLLQLAAALAAGLLGYRIPALFLAIYGLSSVAALAVALPLVPGPLRFRTGMLSWARTLAIARYTAPLILSNAFTTVWLGADVVMIVWLLSAAAAGRYAAAKVVVNGFAIVSWAVSNAVMPRASRLTGAALRAHLLRALWLTAAAVVPVLLVLVAVARPLVGLVFGDSYLEAATPLLLLAAGMALYTFFNVMESAWLGLGRPVVAAVASASAMAGIVVAGLLLIPRLGLAGAALAFGAGSAAQLAVLGTLTVLSPRFRDGPDRLRPAVRPVLVIGSASDRLVAGLDARRPALSHALKRSWPTLLGAARPVAVVYVSRSPEALTALLRARLLKLVCRAPVALVELRATSRPARAALRLLGPDLLLVATDRERDAGRAAGVLTETVPGAAGPGDSAQDALAGRLAALLEDLELDRRAGGTPVPALAARVGRLARDWRGLPRRIVWRGRPGYQAQRTATAPLVPVEEPAPGPAPNSPRSATVGVVAPPRGSSPLAAAAGMLGLRLEAAGAGGVRDLVDRALAEHWEVIGAQIQSLAGQPEALAALAAYAKHGGTLYLDGLDELSGAALQRLGLGLPAVRRAPAGRRLLLPGEQAAFAGPLAGTELDTSCGNHRLEPCDQGSVLAWSVAAGRQAVVVQTRTGRGRVVLSTLPLPPPGRPVDGLASNEAGGLVVPLLLLRQRYGQAAWHAPCPTANFTIDDPALRQGLLGLRYDLLAAQARDHRFHVTIATVPRELPLADEAAVRRLRQHPGLLSACYHGCDHAGYEFYVSAAGRTRYRPRPLHEQRAALWRAVEQGRRFADAHGCQLDRVMVFPYGVGPASLFPDLHRLGFVATCNFWDKYPLEAPVPAEADLGVRPADLAWQGFPLLWRRSLGDQGYLIDLLLGRPVLLFAHRRDLGRDFLPFVERAQAINRASRGEAAWRGLDEVARHAYLQRRTPGGDWEVLMTGNEACLHNPDPVPRTCAVTRPYLPPGSHLEAAGAGGRGPLLVTIPAGASTVVRVVTGAAAPPLGGARRCSVFGADHAAFAEATGARTAVATSSGTAAL